MKYQCWHLKSASSILRETLARLSIVSFQCRHILLQFVVAATINYGSSGHSRDAWRTMPSKHWRMRSLVVDYITVTCCTTASLRDSWVVCNRSRTPPIVLFRYGRREHITPVLRQLHWLPVRERVMFKLATLVHRSLAGTAPPYLSVECRLITSVQRALSSLSRTQGHVFLVEHTMVFGDRCFAAYGPSLVEQFTAAASRTDYFI